MSLFKVQHFGKKKKKQNEEARVAQLQHRVSIDAIAWKKRRNKKKKKGWFKNQPKKDSFEVPPQGVDQLLHVNQL